DWREEAKLVAPNGELEDAFGCSVAIDGDVIVVGARYRRNQGQKTGSVFVYRFDGRDWQLEAELLASDRVGAEEFGCSVRLQHEILLVGAYNDHQLGARAGAAYVFRYDGTDWLEESKLIASDGKAKALFGWNVALAGDTAVIGAYHEGVLDFGSAYVFRGISDCNSNGILDLCDVGRGSSPDRNSNDLPDECEPFPTALSQNTSGEPDDIFLGPPDDVWLSIGSDLVEYDLGDLLVVDGEGPDLSVYEFETGQAEFELIDVQLSEDGEHFVSVGEPSQPVVRLPGDGARGVNKYIRSYDLAGTGLTEARYARVVGLGDGYGDDGPGFELDAIGVVNTAGPDGE
ncbi:MAG: FG-GAP repeat protein, partial [Planctomycetota bacterium]